METGTVAEKMDWDVSDPAIDPQIAEEAKQEGNKAYKSGEYAEAVRFYTRAISHCEKCAVYYGNRSAAYMMMGDYQRALDDCIKSVQLDENFTKGYLRAAKCYLMLGNPSLSMDYYRKVLLVEKKNKQAQEEMEVSQKVLNHLERARKETERGEHRTAVYYMDRCLDEAPDCSLFKVMKAEALMFSRRFDDSHSMANDLLRADRNNAEAMYVKAMCFYYQDVPDRATQFFQHALRVAPDHTKSRGAIKRSKSLSAKKEKGNEAVRRGDYSEAYQIYTEALAIDPLNIFTNAKLYCNKALAGSKLGKLEEAIQDCTQAIELDEKYLRAYQRRAKLYQDNNQHDEAVRDYEKILQFERTHENQATLKDAKRKQKLAKRKDYYKILGIGKSATQSEIKQAYRRCALKHHPDRHSCATVEVREAEETIFKDVSEAYSVLSDQQKKDRYDNGYDLDELGGMDFDPNDLFANLFGGGGGYSSYNGFGGHGGSRRGGSHTFTFGGPGGMHFQF